MKHFMTATLMGFMIGLTACSTQWREADPGITSNEMFSRIDEVIGVSTSSVGSQESTFLDIIKNDQQSILYFAEGPGPIGNAQSVAAFYDFSFVGKEGYSAEDVTSAMVVFAVGSDGRYGLLVHIAFNGEETITQTFINTQDPVVTDDSFQIEMTNGTSTIELLTYDIGGGAIKDVIQLVVGTKGSDGQISWDGKFSTLVGFAP